MARPPIDRGDVWMVDLGMAAKSRPCLVLSVKPEPTDKPHYTLIPHTTTLHGTQYEIDIPKTFLQHGAFDIQNMASMYQTRFQRKLGFLLASELVQIEDAVRKWLRL